MAERFARRGRMGVFVVAAMLAGAALSPAAAVAADKIQEVLVANGDENPIPTKAVGVSEVTGGVSVTNTPTVTAQQDGVYDVNLTGTDGPVAVSQVPHERFQHTGRKDRINLGAGWGTSDVEVPEGKDLVVTSVSARSEETLDGTVRSMYVAPDAVNLFDAPGTVFIAFEREMPEGSAAWVAYAQTDLYVPDDVRLYFNGRCPACGADDMHMDWTVNGYLVDERAA